MNKDLFKPGAFSWFELMTDDAEAAKDFYGKLFGWKMEKYPVEDGDYWVVKIGDDGVAGIMKKPAEAGPAPNFWAIYVTVDDVDKVAETAKALGAWLLVPPMDIPKIGRFTTFMDPQGAVISAIAYAPMEA